MPACLRDLFEQTSCVEGKCLANNAFTSEKSYTTILGINGMQLPPPLVWSALLNVQPENVYFRYVQRGLNEANLRLRRIVLTQFFGVIATFVQIHMTCWCICSIFAQVCIFNELRKAFLFQLFLFSSCYKYLYNFALVTEYKIHVNAVGIFPLH